MFLNYHIENKNDEKCRKESIDYIDRYIGDPRIRKHSNNWKGVDEHLKQIYLKYKVRLSITFFFGFISKGADKSAIGQRQWEQRKKYWSWFLENDLIDDAWVILGSSAHYDARRQIKDSGFQQYGVGDLRDYDKSHVMMQIKNILIVECSHNGALWVFDIEDSNCPSMGNAKYQKTQFKYINEYGKGYLYHKEGWESKLDDIIKNRTKLKISKLRRRY